MLNGAKSPDGALYVSTVAPQPGDVYNGGIAMTPLGVVRVTQGSAPTGFVNGLGVVNPGALAIALGGVIAGYNNGLPVTDTGALVCQLNQPVSPGDAYVGGIRVGPLGGVYLIDTAPVLPFSFSIGFSGGFDAP